MTRYLFSAENRITRCMRPGSPEDEAFIASTSRPVPGGGRRCGRVLLPGRRRRRHGRDGGLEPRLGIDEEVRAQNDDIALLQTVAYLHDPGTVIAHRDLARHKLSFT